MNATCPPEPDLVAFVKTFGLTFGLVAAALAWLLNRIVSWCVWEGRRFLDGYEMMKIIHADISDTQRVEANYADADKARQLIEHLKATLPADAPLAPYVAVDNRQFGFDDGAKEIRLLPLRIIEAVFKYYRASGGLAVQLLDFRSDVFRSLSRSRQEAVILDTYVFGASVGNLADTAKSQLVSGMRMHRRYAAVALVFGGTCVLAAVVLAVEIFPKLLTEISAAVEWARACDASPTKLY